MITPKIAYLITMTLAARAMSFFDIILFQTQNRIERLVKIKAEPIKNEIVSGNELSINIIVENIIVITI